LNPLLLSLESRVVEWDFGCIFPAFLLAMKLGGANFFLVFDHRSQTAFFFFCSSWCSNQSFLGSNQWMNEIQLFLAVMLSFKSSKGLIFFSMIFFEHTTVLVTFFRSFLFFLFYWNGIFWGWDSRGWGVFFGGSTLQTSSSVIAAELAQLKSRANWTILSSDISLDTHGIDVMVQPRVAVVLEVLISVMSLSLVMYESRWSTPRKPHMPQGCPVISAAGIARICRGRGGVVEVENVWDGVRNRWLLHWFT